MTDSGTWTAHGVMGKVYVVEKNGNKGLLFKSHQESVSFIPSNGDPDVIRGGAALHGASEGNPAERIKLAAGLQLQAWDIT